MTSFKTPLALAQSDARLDSVALNTILKLESEEDEGARVHVAMLHYSCTVSSSILVTLHLPQPLLYSELDDSQPYTALGFVVSE